MPTSEEKKELALDTSKRGQPIPPDILAEAESIGGDTKRTEFYAVDQDRDEQGRFADEGKSAPGPHLQSEAELAASMKKDLEAIRNAPKPTPMLSKALDVWTNPFVPDADKGGKGIVGDSEAIRGMRDAARAIKAGKDVTGEHADMAKAMLSHSEVIPFPLMRGTSSAYFAKPDAPPEEVLSKFPIGEDVDLTLYSFSENLSWPHGWDAPKLPFMFAKWATDRKGGSKMYITIERGATSGLEVDKYKDTGDENPEEEAITTGHAKVKSAKFNKELKQFEITLGK